MGISKSDFLESYNLLGIAAKYNNFALYTSFPLDAFNKPDKTDGQVTNLLNGAKLEQNYLDDSFMIIGLQYFLNNNFGVYGGYCKGGTFSLEMKEMNVGGDKQLFPSFDVEEKSGADLGVILKADKKLFNLGLKVGGNTITESFSLGVLIEVKP